MTSLGGYMALITASTWILTFTVHSFVAQLVALTSTRLTVRSPRLRSGVWKCALIAPMATATIATSGWQPLSPIADIRVPQLVRAEGTVARGHVFVEQRAIRRNGAPPQMLSFMTDSTALRVAGAVAAAALTCALIGLIHLMVRRRRFRRRVGPRMFVDQRDAYRLTQSASIGAPVALGTAEICVPATTFWTLDPVEQRSVLAHEAAHLAQHDPFWFALADLVVALTPWQPLVRRVVKELRRDAEFSCDDAVVRATGDGRPLVQSLAAFAAAFDPAETAFAASCGGSPLEERARRILAPATRPHRAAVPLTVALMLVLTGVALATPVFSTHTGSVRTPAPGTESRRELIVVRHSS